MQTSSLYNNTTTTIPDRIYHYIIRMPCTLGGYIQHIILLRGGIMQHSTPLCRSPSFFPMCTQNACYLCVPGLCSSFLMKMQSNLPGHYILL